MLISFSSFVSFSFGLLLNELFQYPPVPHPTYVSDFIWALRLGDLNLVHRLFTPFFLCQNCYPLSITFFQVALAFCVDIFWFSFSFSSLKSNSVLLSHSRLYHRGLCFYK
ncbi:hypothetical protein K435DRAFT_471092 [Dendrothele bispora CBS 962.96]|uniref:Uncharacterized protein n=1 Tax=Dendrothele bispora (strain CBS 962.96) TaxID=1314807 RepID=A0A4V6T507_DENBC|nr:hypothetical protein K435DRAFT_471092 [Dendrothele bispora CBS 962.96]